jgi:hypothetical protein
MVTGSDTRHGRKYGGSPLGEAEIIRLRDAAALVLRQWKLDRQNEPVRGKFTLALRKIDARW